MKKQIYDEKNGMSYTLHGDYYLPDLVLRKKNRHMENMECYESSS